MADEAPNTEHERGGSDSSNDELVKLRKMVASQDGTIESLREKLEDMEEV